MVERQRKKDKDRHTEAENDRETDTKRETDRQTETVQSSNASTSFLIFGCRGRAESDPGDDVDGGWKALAVDGHCY